MSSVCPRGAEVALDDDDPSVRAIVADSGYGVVAPQTVAASVLFLGNTDDPNVPHTDVVAYEQRRRAAGNDVESHYYDGTGHIATLTAPDVDDATQRTVTFLDQHLKQSRTGQRRRAPRVWPSAGGAADRLGFAGMTDVGGSWDDRFIGVRDSVAGLIDSGQDVGCSACVVLEGEIVADVWAGWADPEKTVPWQRDTIVNVWSTTKTMTALSALVLADRGELDVDAPVAQYWPEFAQNGKEGVLVRHLLSHTAGLPGFDPPLSIEELCDWDTTTANLAAQAPWWEPGTASGYHALTQGQLVGEVVRRVSGSSLGQFFAKEIAGPLGADFHIGTDPVHFDRISNVIAPPDLTLGESVVEQNDVQRKMLASTPGLTAQVAHTEAWRRAEFPAGNGHGNARSVAVVQGAVSNGGTSGGVRILSKSPEELIFREQCNGTDLVLGIPLRHGIGYGLPGELIPFPSPRTCFWGGWGGSLVINDFENRMTVAYVMNKMGEGTTGDFRGGMVLAAAYGALNAA